MNFKDILAEIFKAGPGEKNIINVIEKHEGNIIQSVTPAPPSEDTLFKAYRECVFNDANKLRLETIHSAGASRKRDLASIYVSLDTLTPKPKPDAERHQAERFGENKKVEYVSALQAVTDNHHVVLHGAPGSGKSTFIQFLTLCLAGEVLHPDQRWRERLAGWPATEARLLPFTIELRRFAKESPRPLTGEALPAHLWDYLAKELKDHHGDGLVPAARSSLEAGRAIIFLDGLDEIAEPPPADGEDPAEGRRKQFVRDVILAFARPPFDRCRIVLTCRTRSYVGQPWALGWPDFGLADFDRDRIIQFVEFWFSGASGKSSVARTDSEIAAQKIQLIGAIDERPHLLEVAGIPLLLTLMAFVHQHEGELPRSQAKLYDKIVDLLLFHWKDEGTGGGASALGLRPLLGPQVSENAFLAALQKIAWDVQHGDQDRGVRKEPADISGERLRNVLADLRQPRSLDWANKVIAVLQLRAGLLRYVSGTAESPVFAFLHRSFQEYFAGAHLANLSNFPKEALKLIQRDLPYWQNTVKWAAGRLAHNQGRFGEVRDLARELSLPFEAASAPALVSHILLAGEIIADAGPRDIANTTQGEECVNAVQTHLKTLMLDESRPADAREETGKVLGKLGDPRPGVGLAQDGLPKIDWVELPEGQFALKEKPDEEVVITPFQFSRYPVTWQQFEAFVQQGGYGEPDLHAKKPAWWTDAGWQWRNGQASFEGLPDWFKEEYAKEKFPILRPKDYGAVFQTPNHPRVGVSWFETAAFCGWLSEKTGRLIRLPHEAQWEWAARWSLKTSAADDRHYPWGGPAKDENEHLSRHCNWDGTGLGHTSAVGLFPSGKADCGVLDLSGNVWEWCEDWYDKNKEEARVLRGGSWYDDDPGFLRSSRRNYSHPEYRNDLVGFRVVCACASAR